MTTNQGDLLRKYLRDQKITQEVFAEKLEMTRQNLNHHMRKEVLEDNFRRLLESKGIDIFHGDQNSIKLNPTGVPYYDLEGSAGAALVYNDKQEIPAHYINIPGFEDCNFWINVFGDSMYPKYSAGEMIACKEVEKRFVAFGEAFLIRLKDGNRYIKMIRKNKEESLWSLVSENDNYDTFDVAIDDVTNVWIIKGKIKKNMI